MTNPLFPCPSCMRHVRVGAAACPFCDGPLPLRPEGLVPGAGTASLSRAALFAFATTVAACSSPQTSETTTATSSTQQATEQQAAQSGGAVVESPPASPPEATPDASMGPGPGAVVALYGAPAPVMMTGDAAAPSPDAAAPSPDVVVADAATDAHRRDAARADVPRPPPDHGAIMVRYGSPPADTGEMMVRYGAPPAEFA